MKVLVRRELRKSGMIKKKTDFFLRVRAELTPEEQALIEKCDAGDTILYTWTPLWNPDHDYTMTVDEMVSGYTVGCDHFNNLIEAEDEIKKACRVFIALLERAKSFGQEEVFDF